MIQKMREYYSCFFLKYIKKQIHKISRGFSLLEILIVVAIIMILASIGIINYQNALVRSKVSRVKGELRTIALALESYNSDNNEYPFNENRTRDIWRLTTPVAYITKCPTDQFGPREDLTPAGYVEYGYLDPSDHYYWYQRWHEPYLGPVTSDVFTPDADPKWQSEWFGMWVLISYGPDNYANGGQLRYDPTNGTRSNGDIMRRQMEKYTQP